MKKKSLFPYIKNTYFIHIYNVDVDVLMDGTREREKSKEEKVAPQLTERRKFFSPRFHVSPKKKSTFRFYFSLSFSLSK
jgi:hypothetical protein